MNKSLQKEECCPECSTPASGAPDETQKECLNKDCKYCHMYSMNTEQKIRELFDKVLKHSAEELLKTARGDKRVINFEDMLKEDTDEEVRWTLATDVFGTFFKSFLTTTLIPLIQEEERAKCRGLSEECKGEMEKEKYRGTRITLDDEEQAYNNGLSTCISILEDKLKEI